MLKKSLAALAIVVLIVFLAGLSRAADSAPTMTNADVVNLVREQIAPTVIIDRIKAANSAFDLSNESVIALKENGVPDDVLAAMLVSSSRGAAGARSGAVGGNLPMRGFGSGFGGDGFQPADLAPPNLPSSNLATPDFPGMEPLGLPGLPDAARAPAPIDLTPPAPIAGDFSTPNPVDFAPPPINFDTDEGDFYSAPPPSPTVAAASSQPRDPDSAAYEEAQKRFDAEIANVMSDSPEKKTAAVAWMVANDKYSLDFLRETMIKGEKPELEAAAVYSLGRLRDAEATTEIRRRLMNRNRLVREAAAEALAYMEDTDAITAAERALTQRAVDPMDGLIRLVGHAKLVRASGNLGRILDANPVPANRLAAAWALTQMGRAANAAWPAMKKALASDQNPEVRRQAARAVASFHDEKESAQLLEAACRKDPEVRKVVLEELASYPESIPFLVNVINLKTDQIAYDEMETTRATLFKLTGEDFSLDGPRWKKWLADNRSRLGLPPPPGTIAMGEEGKIPPGMKKGPAHLAAGRPRQVDVRSWGIVADPAEIPLAPEVDESPASPRAGSQQAAAGGLPPPPGLGLGSGMGMGPAMGPGMGSGAGAMGGMGSGMGPGMAGGGMGGYDDYDDEDDDYGYGAPSGGMGSTGGFGGMGGFSGSGEAAPSSGMRLPLPSGLMGSGGDDRPPLPVATGAPREPAGLGGMGGGMSGMGGMTDSYDDYDDYDDFDAPVSPLSDSFSGGMTTPPPMPPATPISPLDPSSYGSPEPYSSGITTGYPADANTYYPAVDGVVQPSLTQEPPLTLEAYTGSDVIDAPFVASPTESTGDLVPDLPLETTYTMGDMEDWEGSIGTSIVEPGDGEDYDFESASGGYDDGYPEAAGGVGADTVSPLNLRPPSASTEAYVSADSMPPVGALVPAAPGAAETPAAGGSVITFPGDTTSFGLGDPLFNEYGQPASSDALEYISGAPAATAAPVESAPVPAETPPAFALPPPPMSSAPDAADAVAPLQLPESGSDSYADSFDDGYDFDDSATVGADSYASPTATTDPYGIIEPYMDDSYQPSMDAYTDTYADTYAEPDSTATFLPEPPMDAPGDFSSGVDQYDGSDENYEDFDDGYEWDEDYAEPPAGQPAAVPPPPPGADVNASPSASTLRLPARRGQRPATESAIVEHNPPDADMVGAGVSTGVDATPPELVEQAIRRGDSVLVTGPFRILDEQGRTTAFVMNSDDQLAPPPVNDQDSYISLDADDDTPVPFIDLSAPPPAAPVAAPTAPMIPAPPTAVVAPSADITVEATPSQRPGRNFRPKK